MLTITDWHAAPPKLEADQRADCPLCRLPAFAPQALDASSAATPDIARGLRAMRDSLALHHAASSAAEQAASACAALAATLRTGPAPHLLFASRLGTTSAMQHLVARMLADPAACVDAYNRAVAKHQVFGLAPLAADSTRKRYELPLWRVPPLDSTGTPMPRQRVYAHTLPSIDPAHLAPRAL
ncbi:MAG: hypothetical protein MUE97_06805, partial [Phycisphaerales bacterium]|nr:hypothetical protein [Phycisphaerales bacterium]